MTGGFKELMVWQKSVDFAVKMIDMMENIKSSEKHFRLKEQVESSAASVAANIAEGKGRNSKKEYIQFLYIARGSLNECVTYLNIFFKKNWIDSEQLKAAEKEADEIGKMINGLIRSVAKTVA